MISSQYCIFLSIQFISFIQWMQLLPACKGQSFIQIKASFAGDCSTALIPGYDNNHEDFYYAAVAGADALHRHGVTGKGVTVAVLDSGLWDHPSLLLDTAGKERVLARYDAIAVDERSRDPNYLTVLQCRSANLAMLKASLQLLQSQEEFLRGSEL